MNEIEDITVAFLDIYHRWLDIQAPEDLLLMWGSLIGLTQSELAERFGCKRQAINQRLLALRKSLSVTLNGV